jgi:hypothetical protein
MTGNMEYIYNMEGVIDKLNTRYFKRKPRFNLSLVYQHNAPLWGGVPLPRRQVRGLQRPQKAEQIADTNCTAPERNGVSFVSLLQGHSAVRPCSSQQQLVYLGE